MPPLFVLADSDLEEEDLRPVLLKLKRKLNKAKKKRKRIIKSDQKVDSVVNSATDTDNLTVPGSCCNNRLLGLKDNVSDKNEGLIGLGTAAGRKRRKITCTCHHDVQRATKRTRTSIRCDNLNNCSTLRCCSNSKNELTALNIPNSSVFVALDCEFVGVGPKKVSALGRCSIVDFHGNVILDIYAQPEEQITDYRTPWSGIRRQDMFSAVPFTFARATILSIIKDKIVIGHALFNDFKVLRIDHPHDRVRDTASYKPLRERSISAGCPTNSLKNLTKALLGRDIQRGEHCSSEDARAALDLYKLVQSEWENKLVGRRIKRSTGSPNNHGTSVHISYLGDEFWPSELFEDSVSR